MDRTGPVVIELHPIHDDTVESKWTVPGCPETFDVPRVVRSRFA